ncbi:hypothetical protein B0H19DRAFT_1248585 [Mycena capillaripes]|nr:hypothetical protein B0H19DRAFT_1248585 [Mycena capillaripes]
MAGSFEFNVDVLLRDMEMTRLVSAAGLVILLYDHLLSLSDEVRFIWPAKFTSSKVAFLVMRYAVLLQMIIHIIQLAGLSDVHFSDNMRLNLIEPSFWYQTIGLLLGGLTFGINDWLVLLILL